MTTANRSPKRPFASGDEPGKAIEVLQLFGSRHPTIVIGFPQGEKCSIRQ
jgi:hypothetical protein